METYVHVLQIVLLLKGLHWIWRDRSDYFAAANLSIYYAVMTTKGKKVTRKVKFCGPDFFVALDVSPEPRRRSWMVENEGKYPDVIVEVLSRRTKNADRKRKKEIYEQTFRTPEYFLFDPETETLAGFRFVDGKYVAMEPNAHGHLWSEKLGMALGLVHEPKVANKVARYFTADGKMIAMPEEEVLDAQRAAKEAREEVNAAQTKAAQATARARRADASAAQATVRARQAEVKAEKLAEKLRALGVNPDELA